MVDTWKFISHVTVFSPFGTVIYRDCVPICTNEIDARYYPVWKAVQTLKRYFDCSLFIYDVRVSCLSNFSPNQFSESRTFQFTYNTAQKKFNLYE